MQIVWNTIRRNRKRRIFVLLVCAVWSFTFLYVGFMFIADDHTNPSDDPYSALSQYIKTISHRYSSSSSTHDFPIRSPEYLLKFLYDVEGEHRVDLKQEYLTLVLKHLLLKKVQVPAVPALFGLSNAKSGSSTIFRYLSYFDEFVVSGAPGAEYNYLKQHCFNPFHNKQPDSYSIKQFVNILGAVNNHGGNTGALSLPIQEQRMDALQEYILSEFPIGCNPRIVLDFFLNKFEPNNSTTTQFVRIFRDHNKTCIHPKYSNLYFYENMLFGDGRGRNRSSGDGVLSFSLRGSSAKEFNLELAKKLQKKNANDIKLELNPSKFCLTAAKDPQDFTSVAAAIFFLKLYPNTKYLIVVRDSYRQLLSLCAHWIAHHFWKGKSNQSDISGCMYNASELLKWNLEYKPEFEMISDECADIVQAQNRYGGPPQMLETGVNSETGMETEMDMHKKYAFMKKHFYDAFAKRALIAYETRRINARAWAEAHFVQIMIWFMVIEDDTQPLKLFDGERNMRFFQFEWFFSHFYHGMDIIRCWTSDYQTELCKDMAQELWQGIYVQRIAKASKFAKYLKPHMKTDPLRAMVDEYYHSCNVAMYNLFMHEKRHLFFGGWNHTWSVT